MNTTRNRLTPSSRSARILILLLSGLICAVSGGVRALAQQCTPTVKTDRGVYPEPTLPTLPAAGGKFCDPTFGAEIMRVTDATECPAPGCGTFYSQWPTFNSNDTMIMIRLGVSSNVIIKAFDPVNFTLGNTIVTSPTLPGGVTMTWEGATWSRLDPDLIYVHVNYYSPDYPATGLKLYTYRVSTNTFTLLRDFGDLAPGQPDYLFELHVDAHDEIFTLMHKRVGTYDPLYFIVWKKSTNTVLKHVANTLATFGPKEIANAAIPDKSGRWIGFPYNLDTGSPQIGDPRMKLLDLQTDTWQTVYWTGADDTASHGDMGTGYSIGHGNFSGKANKRPLTDVHSVTTLFDYKDANGVTDWSNDQHMSLYADDESWAMMGLYDESDVGETGAFENEIMQFSTTDPQKFRRLAHHRSAGTEYWSIPKPTISRDGRFIAFTSNWENATGRTDLFILKVPQGSGNSLALDGVDDYVQAPDSDSLDVHNSPITVEAWVKYNSTGLNQTIVGKESHGQTGGGGGYELSINNLGKARLNIWTDSATYVAAIGATTVTPNVWHHIAAVVDGSQRRIYLDGVLDTSVNGATLPQAGTGTFNIGRRGNNTYRFGGLVDEVRVSAAALYASNFTPETSLTSDAATTRGLWKFDGQTANDFSANANNGTLQGGATYSADVPVASSYSLLLNGTDASVQAPDSDSLDLANSPITLEAWVKYNSTGLNQTIIGKESHGVASGGGGYELSITNLGKARLNIWTAYNVYVAVIGATTLTPDVWHHIAAVADGSQRRIYLDGVLDGSATGTQLPAAGTGTFNIGRRGNNTYRFDGRIDEVRVSNAAVYTSNFTPPPSLTGSASTKGLWKFDNQTAADDSGNGNHGTLQGGAVYSTDVP
jgi:Concanavalin A-like lectin/glucanases superfamily